MKGVAVILTACALYCGAPAFAAELSPPPIPPAEEGRTAAEIEREQLMLKVLRQAPVPLKTQDKVVRVLFLPYVDTNGVLHNYKWSFMSVEEGKWVLGDYLMKPTGLDRRVLKPLANPAPASAVQQKPRERQGDDKDTPKQSTAPRQPEERTFDTHEEDGRQ